MMQAVLVGLTVFALEFIETWCSYPMTTCFRRNRPIPDSL